MGFNANDNHPLTNDTYDWGDKPVGGNLNERALSSLSRCAFLLHKIIDGDHHALVNACSAVDEAVALLREAGQDEEWMECSDAVDECPKCGREMKTFMKEGIGKTLNEVYGCPECDDE